MKRDLTEEKALFLEFKCLRKKDRMEKFGFQTGKDFSEKYGVTQKTLSVWNKSKAFQREKSKFQRSLAGDSLADVLDALTKVALEGDVPAIKLYLEYMRELLKNDSNVSADDLDLFLQAIVKLARKHFHKFPSELNAFAKDLEKLDIESLDEV